MTGTGSARVGCSGWMYDDWRDLVYEGAPKRTWFDRYTLLFDTVELNATFYRLPQRSTVERWAEVAPAGFRYALKLGQFGSHRMKLRDPVGWVGHHIERLDLLGEHAGPTLVQLPPNWRVNAARLADFLEAWPPCHRVAVELRHASWLTDAVFSVLEQHGAALCLHDLLADLPLVRTAEWTYLRFHGTRPLIEPYRGRYGAQRLEPLAQVLDEWLAEGTDVDAYFNNDWDANAVADASWLARRLALGAARRQSVELVAELQATFAEIVEATEDVATDDEHDPEGHTIAFERQQVAGLLREAEHRASELDAAIVRIDSDDDGVCEGCGKPISRERLKALPEARVCIDCAR